MRRDIYSFFTHSATFALGAAFFASAVVSLPENVSAFWPFSTDAEAAVNTTSTFGSETQLLVAATNTDPNPNKGLGANIQSSDGALLAYTGPSGTIAGIASPTSLGRISVYVVRAGDTLSDIASMFGVSVNTIKWANNLDSTRIVRAGDTLIILPVSGVERKIVKGDTLQSLAKKYSADAEEIALFNGLDLSAPLEIGSTIIIPGGEIATPVVTAPKPRPSVTNIGVGLQTGYYINPLPGGLITQRSHGWNGVDIGAARGTPIYAAADGTVLIARSNGGWNGGYGNYIVIAHDNGTQTLYSHMRSVIVSPRQSVNSGQTIGYVGATGRATGPHLHFEVRGAANPLKNCSVGSICIAQ